MIKALSDIVWKISYNFLTIEVDKNGIFHFVQFYSYLFGEKISEYNFASEGSRGKSFNQKILFRKYLTGKLWTAR